MNDSYESNDESSADDSNGDSDDDNSEDYVAHITMAHRRSRREKGTLENLYITTLL